MTTIKFSKDNLDDNSRPLTLTGERLDKILQKFLDQDSKPLDYSRILHTKCIGRLKTVLKPSAQITKELTPGFNYLAEVSRISNIIKSLKYSQPVKAIILELQLLNGLRISEALSIKMWNIDSLGLIRLKSLKGGNNRTARVVITNDILMKFRNSNIDCFKYETRYTMYKYYKSVNIGCSFGDNINSSVTHYFRHLYALQASQSGATTVQLQSELGHRNIKNTLIYEKNAKR